MSAVYSTQTFDTFTLATVAHSTWAGNNLCITTWYRASCARCDWVFENADRSDAARCDWVFENADRSAAYRAGLDHDCRVAA